MSRKKKPPNTLGLIKVQIGSRGHVDLVVEFVEGATTDPEGDQRIRSILSGLSYFYRNNGGTIETMGEAYLEGINAGLRISAPPKEKETTGLKIGFTADL